jgi:hypothetical protein
LPYWQIKAVLHDYGPDGGRVVSNLELEATDEAEARRLARLRFGPPGYGADLTVTPIPPAALRGAE